MPLLKDLNYKIMAENNSLKFVWLYDLITGIFMLNRKCDGRVDYNLIRKFPAYIKDTYFDYFICQFQWTGLGGYYCKGKLGIKYAVVFHGHVNNMPWIKNIKRIIANLALWYRKKIVINADKGFALTYRVANSINTFYHRKITVKLIFPVLTNNIISNYETKKNQLILLSFSNAVKIPRSDFPIFKNIFNYNFIIVGNLVSENYRNKFIDTLKNEDVINMVKFVANISETEIIESFNESKLNIRFGNDRMGPVYETLEAIEVGILIVINTGLEISDYVNGSNFAPVPKDIDDIDYIAMFFKNTYNRLTYNKRQIQMDVMMNKHSLQLYSSTLLSEIGGEHANR